MQETYKIPFNVIKKLCGLDSLKIENVIISNKTLLIEAVSNEKSAYCYVCNQRSKIKHSSYKRQLSTLPVSDLKTVISLRIYKYRCTNPCCSRKIFSQQIKGLSNRYGRRTHSLNNKLEKISIEVSANKASYISSLINSPLSSSTCLRLVKRAKMLNNTDCVIVGIDDWAKRKGINYGTIIVDAETHKTIDLIDSRKKSDIVSWLSKHQTIKFITRDRAAFYASAISEALPHVKHIADKFHLIKNLSDAIFIEVKNMFGRIRKIAKNYINSSYVDINDIEAVEDVVMIKDDNHKYQAELDKRKTRFELFYNLKNEGLNNTLIARRTGYSRDTVRKYLTHGIPNTAYLRY